MADYEVNEAGVAHVRDLIDKHQYVLDSDWGDVQPDADAAERLPRAALLGRVRRLAPRPDRRAPPTRPRRATPSSPATCGGCTAARLIACVYRAGEWRHKKVELAAHDLLQHLDAVSGHA